jgi:hypothetical protein
MKDIERSDLISIRYFSEIDEAVVSTLNLCPSFATGALTVIHLSGALVVHYPILYGTVEAILVLHGLIFCFICDDLQQGTLRSYMHSFIHPHVAVNLLFDFLSNSQRSQHHAVDNTMHNSITERCFSYILNHRLPHFPGLHDRARKSKHRPWLWRWRKPKGAITDSQFRWQQKEHIGCNKKLEPFWALVLALKYLPYLLNKATRSGELVALAKMWPYRYPPLVSLFPHDTKKAGKAVKQYLSRFDGKEQCESEIAVGCPLLCIVSNLIFADRNDLLVCLTPPSGLPFQCVHIASELATSVTERLTRWLTSRRIVCASTTISHIFRHKLA